jgi:hypothetical protein
MSNSEMLNYGTAEKMARYEVGDYVKVEFADEQSGAGEWMWVLVERCDDVERTVFGILDSVPIVHAGRLHVGQKLVVSFDKVREHRSKDAFT